MSKEAYYFSHDSNARNDEKILSLRMDLGMEGYGIFWSIIEMLRDSNNYKMRTHYERIAFELHVNSESVKKVINDYELFTIDDNFFYSESLLVRMQKKEEKSKKARESAFNRWNNTKKMRTHSESNAIKEKEIKKKESKSNEIKVNDNVYKSITKMWFDFIEERNGIKPSFDGAQGKSLKSIINYIEKQKKENTKTEDTFLYILNHWNSLDEWMQTSCLDLKIFNSKINVVIDQIKNGKKGFTKTLDKHFRETDPNYSSY